ncbi:MAG: hypothetical protein GY820_00040, partial [Gammaproteobacteria bacterium]|nr:hypothetical protein [Gammaproteobacteria bacterium]
MSDVYKAIRPPIGNMEIASCTGVEVPIMGQAVVSVQIDKIKCNTPMLIMKTNSPRAECLLGVYALRQMGFMLFAPTGEELLGHDVSQLPNDQRPKVEAPVKLPKTAHTQVNLLKCYSTKPLELGPLNKGQIKMKAPECDEKGAYLFTPSDQGQAAGLRQSSVMLNKDGQFRLKVANHSMQQSISVSSNAVVGTIGKAHLMEYGEFRAEVERREVDHEQKLRDNEQLRDEGLHNGRVEKLLQTVPFGPEATAEEKERVQEIIADFNDVFAVEER